MHRAHHHAARLRGKIPFERMYFRFHSLVAPSAAGDTCSCSTAPSRSAPSPSLPLPIASDLCQKLVKFLQPSAASEWLDRAPRSATFFIVVFARHSSCSILAECSPLLRLGTLVGLGRMKTADVYQLLLLLLDVVDLYVGKVKVDPLKIVIITNHSQRTHPNHPTPNVWSFVAIANS